MTGDIRFRVLCVANVEQHLQVQHIVVGMKHVNVALHIAVRLLHQVLL